MLTATNILLLSDEEDDMSHNIQYFTYKEDVNRKRVQAELDNYVAHEDWEEGCTGLYSPIRWIEHCGVLNSYDEALEYIKRHDKGWYDCLAVRYKESVVRGSAALRTAQERLEVAEKKWRDLDSKLHYADVKSDFIGCRNCGSKVSRKYLKSNRCPVCNSDMRPQSTLDTLARYKANLDKQRALVAEEKKKSASKNGKTLWLVKIEYHT
jgi:predicted Zn-ribbon and HTH transcriptional regulator